MKLHVMQIASRVVSWNRCIWNPHNTNLVLKNLNELSCETGPDKTIFNIDMYNEIVETITGNIPNSSNQIDSLTIVGLL